MKKISLQKNWREIFFSSIMGFVLFISCVIFAKEPSMSSFLKGSYLLGLSFIATFFFCGGHNLPDEKTWQTFGDTVTISLGIMLVVQIILAILAFEVFNITTGGQFFVILICLILFYMLAFFFFVIQACSYKGRKEQEEKQA